MGGSTTYGLPHGVVTQAVGAELILLNSESETYYSLDSVGAAMFTALSNGNRLKEVVEIVSSSFDDVDPVTVEADVVELIRDLEQRRLLEQVRG